MDFARRFFNQMHFAEVEHHWENLLYILQKLERLQNIKEKESVFTFENFIQILLKQ